MCQLGFFVTVRNEVAKVMFLQVSICPQGLGGGGIPACIAGGVPACLAAGLHGGGCAIPACIAGGIPACLATSLKGGGLLPGGSGPGGVPALGGMVLGGTWSWGGLLPGGGLLLQMVRILLECILVVDFCFLIFMEGMSCLFCGSTDRPVLDF